MNYKVLAQRAALRKKASLDKKAAWYDSVIDWLKNSDNQKKLAYGGGSFLGTYLLSGLLDPKGKNKGARALASLGVGFGVGSQGDKIHNALFGAKTPAAPAAAPAPAPKAEPKKAPVARNAEEAAQIAAEGVKTIEMSADEKAAILNQYGPAKGKKIIAEREAQLQKHNMKLRDDAGTAAYNAFADKTEKEIRASDAANNAARAQQVSSEKRKAAANEVALDKELKAEMADQAARTADMNEINRREAIAAHLYSALKEKGLFDFGGAGGYTEESIQRIADNLRRESPEARRAILGTMFNRNTALAANIAGQRVRGGWKRERANDYVKGYAANQRAAYQRVLSLLGQQDALSNYEAPEVSFE